jgi:hypothetical protein
MNCNKIGRPGTAVLAELLAAHPALPIRFHDLFDNESCKAG